MAYDPRNRADLGAAGAFIALLAMPFYGLFLLFKWGWKKLFARRSEA